MAQLVDEIVFQSGVKLHNRIVMAPMTIQSAFFDGGVTQEMINYYAARSGDAGAIIVESAFVENYGRAFPGALGIDTDSKIAGLTKLADAIKAKGSKAILQIYHAGRMANPEFNGGHQPISASPVAALRDNAETPLEMTKEQIEEMIDRFGLLPQQTKQLFAVTSLKLFAEILGISRINANDKQVKLQFGKDTQVDPGSIIKLIQSNPMQYQLKSGDTLIYHDDAMDDAEARVNAVTTLLDRLGNKAHA